MQRLPKYGGSQVLHCLQGFCIAVGCLCSRAEEPSVSFVNQVAPVLQARCVPCHNSDKSKGGYQLHTFQSLSRPGKSKRKPISPGHPTESELFRLLITSDPDDRMPQNGDPLSSGETALIERWIQQGAKFDGPDPNATLSSYLPAAVHQPPPDRYPFPWPVTAVGFDSTGRQIAAAGFRELVVYDYNGLKPAVRMTNVAERILGVGRKPHADEWVVAGGLPGQLGELRFLGSSGNRPVKVLDRRSDSLFALAFSPVGDLFATGGADGAIHVFQEKSGNQIKSIEQHSDWVLGLAYSPDGSQLASASRDKSCRVFDVRSGEMVCGYLEHKAAVRAVVFDASGKLVLSGGADKKIHIWNSSDAKKSAELVGFESEITALVMAGELVCSASADGRVRVHSLASKQLLRTLAEFGCPVDSLAWSPATRKLVCGTRLGELAILDPEREGILARTVVGNPLQNSRVGN